MPVSSFYEHIEDTIKRDDIRGIYGVNIDSDYARNLGRIFGGMLRGATVVQPVNVVVGHDMRLSGPALAAALGEGLAQAGCRPIYLGLAGTELVGFLPAHYEETIDGGVIITASHNPPDNNGFKFFGRRGQPLPLALDLDAPCPESPMERLELGLKKSAIPCRLAWKDFAPDYVSTAIEKGGLNFERAASDASSPMRVAVEAGNGMGGRIMAEFARISPQFEWSFSHDSPDGRFPLIIPNPLMSEYQQMVAELVEQTDSDVGMCFDGDADRVAIADEKGDMISPPQMIALIGQRLRNKLGAQEKIAHNLACSWVVADTLGDRHRVLGGGPTLMTPVGYGKIKVIMHDHPEIAFGAEHSGHYMFRDFYRADSGMLAGLIMLELAAELHAEGKTLSAELEEMRSRYFPSGEINFEMPAADPATDAIARAVDEFSSDAERMYAVAPEGIKQIDSYPPEFDQTVEDVRVEAEDWWFCMRKSGTEGSGGGICRLYVEAVGEEALMREKCDALAQLVGQEHRM